eukprot:CAMPEP_0202458712 /NCGR_PEP_ID=MMETSP1360-20130828/27379_1 /ASSEMBLY_ACC=CAM_ASM_000848 /TAXON_ID=515479 /ORGANISM="Licmophora paradoxa, Strain CCMP2313" /LENGTH=127 /DNA_ID=CAMNT_0049079389 /DNA_START=14 /DNA_END=397 /DNA_ORIENTATION=+
MIRNAVLAILCFLSYQVTCFSPLSDLKSFKTINTDSLQTKFNAAALAGIATASSAVTPALAVDSYEVADLPPPYIPVIFGLGLLVGVGLLTGSLGDIMSEEASLGMLSGAQAKKEMQRSKSSYFKKR